MATATSAANPDQLDRLSDLPDALLLVILSFLPMHLAARTSLLARRFRHLWKTSSSLKLISRDLPRFQFPNFVAMSDHALLRRKPTPPLLSLHLDLTMFGPFDRTAAASFVSSLLSKARSLQLRHLTIGNFVDPSFAPIVADIFSISTLISLSLGSLPHTPPEERNLPSKEVTFPSGKNLSCLTSLSLDLCATNPVELVRLLSELGSLQDLHLEVKCMPQLSLFSKTITDLKLRKLELVIHAGTPKLETLGLFIPSLESLHMVLHDYQSDINVEAPLLRKAKIVLDDLHVKDASTIAKLLNCISHVEELSLCIEEFPIHILFEPEKDVLNFPNLKHLDVTACFPKHNLAIIRMFHHSPALESLSLVHKVPKFRKENDWGSKLPLNNDGKKHDYAHFRNLHLGENRKEFMKWVIKECTNKRKAGD